MNPLPASQPENMPLPSNEGASPMQKFSESALNKWVDVSQQLSKAYKNFQNLNETYIDKTLPVWTKKTSWKGTAKQCGIIAMGIISILLPSFTPKILKALGVAVKYLLIPVGPHTPHIIAGVILIILISTVSFLIYQKLKQILLKEPKKEEPSAFQGLLDALNRDNNTTPPEAGHSVTI